MASPSGAMWVKITIWCDFSINSFILLIFLIYFAYVCMYAHKIRYKGTKKIQYTQIKTQNFIFFAFFFKKIWSVQKKAVPLHPLSKNRSVLCPFEGHAPLLNGVMVALQILVLSVWVRVLVEQHRRDLMGLFLVSTGLSPRFLSRLKPRTIIATQFSPPLRSVDYCCAIFESWLSNKEEQSPSGGCSFFCLNLWTRTHHSGSPQILICGESADVTDTIRMQHRQYRLWR